MFGSLINRLFAVLALYRPTLNRFIYGLSLLGLLDSAHIALQVTRGFEGGCFGSVTPAVIATMTNCGAVIHSPAGTLLGVSNTYWGLIFYAAVAASSFALLYLSRRWAALVRAARALLIMFGFSYTMYLVYYQLVVLNEVCLLCMISAGLITGLFVAQLIGLFHRPKFTFARPAKTYQQRREAKILAVMTLVVGLLIVADIVHFKYFAEPVDPLEQMIEEEFGHVDAPDGSSQV